MAKPKWSKSGSDANRQSRTHAPSLWGGRFQSDAAREFLRLNNSFPFDHRLLPFDIVGSIAYCRALQRAGVLNRAESRAILSGLDWLRTKCSRDESFVREALDDYEDVHSFVEAQLVRRVGKVGKKIHTGRSRNDQVALDLRLYLRQASGEIRRAMATLLAAFLSNARKHFSLILPGYTHLQRAQPILMSHYWLSYFEMLRRDWERFQHFEEKAASLPLGSGALAGSGFPIDRDFLAKELGFHEISRNSLDAVSDRDFAIEFLSHSSILMVHLSRLAEDLILYSTSEFNFVELCDTVTSGSSIMPQKKNPDALELIRGKSGRVFGNLQRLLVVMKGLPLAYNKDLQEDKEALFDTVDTLESVLWVLPEILTTLKVKPEQMRRAAELGYSNATECADYLARKGLPFREAHATVGRMVVYAISQDCPLERLTLQQFRSFSLLFGPDVFKEIQIERSIARKSIRGGTASTQVKKAIQDAERYVAKIKSSSRRSQR